MKYSFDNFERNDFLFRISSLNKGMIKVYIKNKYFRYVNFKNFVFYIVFLRKYNNKVIII